MGRRAMVRPVDPKAREEFDRKQLWKKILSKKTYDTILDHTIEIASNTEKNVDTVIKEMVDMHVKQNIWKPVVTYDPLNATKEVRYKRISREKAKTIELSQNLIEESKSMTSRDIDSRIEALTRSQSKKMSTHAVNKMIQDGYMVIESENGKKEKIVPSNYDKI